MTNKQALKTILENWDALIEKQKKESSYGTPDREGVVWFTFTDHAGSYEVDEEWLGVKKDGTIVWAYASGCSCWGGGYEIHETHDEKEIKTFTFNHEDMKAEWQEKLVAFAKEASTLNK